MSSIYRTEADGLDETSPGGNSEHRSSNAEAHKCSACKACFTRIEHLRRHITSIHSGQSLKPHTCEFCGKGYSRRDVLLRHYQSCRSAVRGSTLPSRRTKRACKSCKDLKLKCTGGPRCEKCYSLGQSCIFPEPHISLNQQARCQMSLSLSQGTSLDNQDNIGPIEGSENSSDTHIRQIHEEKLQYNGHLNGDHREEMDAHTQSRPPISAKTPPSEQPPISKRGRYVSKACINCQKRKVKCSGEDPCLHCRNGVLECIYSRTRKHNSITAVVPNTDNIHVLELPSTFETEHQQTHSAMARLLKLEQEFRKFKTQNKRRGDYEKQFDSEPELINDEDAATPKYSTPSTSLDSSETFHGATSLYEPLRVLDGTSVVGREPGVPHDSASSSWQNLNRTHVKDIRITERALKNNIPGLRHSLDIYFSYLNPHYPILNENDFRTKFESFVDDGHQPDSADDCQFIALINLIHGIVQILHDNCLDPKVVPGWQEFCRAESIMSQLFSFGGEGNIVTIQCLFLKSHYLLYLEKGDSAFDTMGRIVHLCFLLRLHNQSAWTNCSDYEIHMRQRIFWSVFNQERILAINCGVPYLIRELDFKVDFPKHFDDKAIIPGQPLQAVESIERSFSSYLFCAAKWGKLAGEIWDSLFSVNAQTPLGRDSEFRITMDARILYTLSQFPSHLQWERNVRHLVGNSDIPPYLFRQALILHLQMNQLRLHLRQESMLGLKYNRTIAEECVLIATSSVNAIHAYYHSRYHKQTNRYSSILYLMGSLLILVCVIVKSDNDQCTRSQAIESFKKGLYIHNELSTNFTMARHALHRMHRIIGRTQEVINSFQTADEFQLQELGPQITDFFNSEPSWMMNLDKGVLNYPFNGPPANILPDGSFSMGGMEPFWTEEFIGNRRTGLFL